MRGTARQYALGRKIIEGKESNPIKKDISSPEKVFRSADLQKIENHDNDDWYNKLHTKASIPSRAANSDSIQKTTTKTPSKNPIHRKDVPPPEKVFKQMDHQKIDSYDNDEKYNSPPRAANKTSIEKPKVKVPSKIPTQKKTVITPNIDDILDDLTDDDIDDIIFDDDDSMEVSRMYTSNKRARGTNFVIPDELIDVMTHKILQNLKSHLNFREEKRPRIKLEIDI